jgi:peroxiredoxin Q/BCP
MVTLSSRRRFFVLSACFALLAAPAGAALKPGDVAPPFDTQASLGGKVFDFKIAEALKKGPVVLYFFPAAFTPGCTLEAHDFAAHIEDYRKLGATVIGVSGDGIGKLNAFSTSECRSKFAVASDGDHKISLAYDAIAHFGPITYSDRTSYVIGSNGKIVYAYRSSDYAKHVANTLEALKSLDRASPAPSTTH